MNSDSKSRSMQWPTDGELVKSTYQSDGFVYLPGFLTRDELSEVRSRLDDYLARLDQLPPMDAFYQQVGNRSTLTQLPRMSEHDAYFGSMLNGPRFRQLAESIWETEVVPRDVAYFDKPPGVVHPTPPHQDGYYFHLDPCEAMTMWLPLDDVDKENGCVRYVRGSHRNGMRPHGRTEVLGFSQGVLDYGDQDRSAEWVAVAAAGDLLVHDALTLHRADPNRSATRHRRALGLVYYSSRARIDRAAVAAYQQRLTEEWKAAGKI